MTVGTMVSVCVGGGGCPKNKCLFIAWFAYPTSRLFKHGGTCTVTSHYKPFFLSIKVKRPTESDHQWGSLGISLIMHPRLHLGLGKFGKQEVGGLKQSFSRFVVHSNHLDILLRCRFFFNRSEMELKICICNKLLGDPAALTTLGSKGVKEMHPKVHIHLLTGATGENN